MSIQREHSSRHAPEGFHTLWALLGQAPEGFHSVLTRRSAWPAAQIFLRDCLAYLRDTYSRQPYPPADLATRAQRFLRLGLRLAPEGVVLYEAPRGAAVAAGREPELLLTQSLLPPAQFPASPAALAATLRRPDSSFLWSFPAGQDSLVEINHVLDTSAGLHPHDFFWALVRMEDYWVYCLTPNRPIMCEFIRDFHNALAGTDRDTKAVLERRALANGHFSLLTVPLALRGARRQNRPAKFTLCNTNLWSNACTPASPWLL